MASVRELSQQLQDRVGSIHSTPENQTLRTVPLLDEASFNEAKRNDKYAFLAVKTGLSHDERLSYTIPKEHIIYVGTEPLFPQEHPSFYMTKLMWGNDIYYVYKLLNGVYKVMHSDMLYLYFQDWAILDNQTLEKRVGHLQEDDILMGAVRHTIGELSVQVQGNRADLDETIPISPHHPTAPFSPRVDHDSSTPDLELPPSYQIPNAGIPDFTEPSYTPPLPHDDARDFPEQPQDPSPEQNLPGPSHAPQYSDPTIQLKHEAERHQQELLEHFRREQEMISRIQALEQEKAALQIRARTADDLLIQNARLRNEAAARAAPLPDPPQRPPPPPYPTNQNIRAHPRQLFPLTELPQEAQTPRSQSSVTTHELQADDLQSEGQQEFRWPNDIYGSQSSFSDISDDSTHEFDSPPKRYKHSSQANPITLSELSERVSDRLTQVIQHRMGRTEAEVRGQESHETHQYAQAYQPPPPPPRHWTPPPRRAPPAPLPRQQTYQAPQIPPGPTSSSSPLPVATTSPSQSFSVSLGEETSPHHPPPQVPLSQFPQPRAHRTAVQGEHPSQSRPHTPPVTGRHLPPVQDLHAYRPTVQGEPHSRPRPHTPPVIGRHLPPVQDPQAYRPIVQGEYPPQPRPHTPPVTGRHPPPAQDLHAYRPTVPGELLTRPRSRTPPVTNRHLPQVQQPQTHRDPAPNRHLQWSRPQTPSIPGNYPMQSHHPQDNYVPSAYEPPPQPRPNTAPISGQYPPHPPLHPAPVSQPPQSSRCNTQSCPPPQPSQTSQLVAPALPHQAHAANNAQWALLRQQAPFLRFRGGAAGTVDVHTFLTRAEQHISKLQSEEEKIHALISLIQYSQETSTLITEGWAYSYERLKDYLRLQFGDRKPDISIAHWSTVSRPKGQPVETWFGNQTSLISFTMSKWAELTTSEFELIIRGFQRLFPQCALTQYVSGNTYYPEALQQRDLLDVIQEIKTNKSTFPGEWNNFNPVAEGNPQKQRANLVQSTAATAPPQPQRQQHRKKQQHRRNTTSQWAGNERSDQPTDRSSNVSLFCTHHNAWGQHEIQDCRAAKYERDRRSRANRDPDPRPPYNQQQQNNRPPTRDRPSQNTAPPRERQPSRDYQPTRPFQQPREGQQTRDQYSRDPQQRTEGRSNAPNRYRNNRNRRSGADSGNRPRQVNFIEEEVNQPRNTQNRQQRQQAPDNRSTQQGNGSLPGHQTAGLGIINYRR